MIDHILENITYAALLAWTAMITYFVTKRKVSKERADTAAQDAELSIIEKQNVAVDQLHTQNIRITSTLAEFQEEIIKLHKETLSLRAENTALKSEICQLQSQIALLVQVNKAEKSFD